MELVDSQSFEFEGRHYEIRVAKSGNEYRVAAFLEDRRANGYTYCVDVHTDFQISATHSIQGYKHLMEIAESDVRLKIWESYISASMQESVDRAL
jgi:hypothetical protein